LTPAKDTKVGSQIPDKPVIALKPADSKRLSARRYVICTGRKARALSKKRLIDHLESLANGGLPSSFYQYSENELRELADYADKVVEFQNAGLDKLFESMSLTMKYIPDFVLISLSNRFLEPPLAARITRKLKLKQITAMGNQLSPDYLAEVSFFQEVKLSARIFAALRKNHASNVLIIFSKRYPLKTLDLYPYLNPGFQKIIRENLPLDQIEQSELHSAERNKTYRQLAKAIIGE